MPRSIAPLAIAALVACLTMAAAAADIIPSEKVALSVETLATGLDHPWAVEVLPDGAIAITERSGNLRILRHGRLGAPLKGMPDVYVGGQAGLLDVALSPDFAEDRLLYFTASQRFGGGIGIVVLSARLAADERSVSNVKTIFRVGHPRDRAANLGARIAFAPDKSMFVTIGDQFTPDLAQDFKDDHGSVIHINRDGSIPTDNPFADGRKALPEIWSKGHRNPQGIVFDTKTGLLYTVEHGARGGDEINHPEPGRNYGWPVIAYGVNYDGSKIGEGTTKAGYEQPLHYWDPSIAPGAIVVYRGKMFPEWNGDFLVTALKFKLLSRLSRDGGGKIVGEEQLLKGRYGRLRDIRQAPDGSLLITTDSGDGALLRISRAE
jgi:glucose/arabinose dehydrogenase